MPRPVTVGAAKPDNLRPIIGSQSSVQQNLDLVKLLEQQQRLQQHQQQQQQQQRQAALSPASPNLQRAAGNYGVPITGRLVPSPTPMVHAGAANALLLQRMMNPNLQSQSPRPSGRSYFCLVFNPKQHVMRCTYDFFFFFFFFGSLPWADLSVLYKEDV